MYVSFACIYTYKRPDRQNKPKRIGRSISVCPIIGAGCAHEKKAKFESEEAV